MALPAFVPGVGPFPRGKGRWTTDPDSFTAGSACPSTGPRVAVRGAGRRPGRTVGPDPITMRSCACSSPAAAGSSAATSSGGSSPRGDEVVVLDKLTYAGNPANLDGRRRTSFVARRHRRLRRGRRGAARAATRSSTSPPRPTSTARSSTPPSSSRPTSSARTSCSSGRGRPGARFVQVSTDEVYGDVEPGGSSAEDDPLRPSSPYAASKAGGDLQVLAYVRTYGVDAVVTRGSNTYGPNQYPEKLDPALRHERARRRAAAGLRRRAPGARLAARRGPLRGDRARARARARRARSTTSAAATSARTSRSTLGSSSCIGRRSGAHPPRRRPPRPRPPLRARLAQAARARLGARAVVRTRACARRSTGTATTGTGGSRSSRANTCATTAASMQSGSAEASQRRN